MDRVGFEPVREKGEGEKDLMVPLTSGRYDLLLMLYLGSSALPSDNDISIWRNGASHRVLTNSAMVIGEREGGRIALMMGDKAASRRLYELPTCGSERRRSGILAKFNSR